MRQGKALSAGSREHCPLKGDGMNHSLRCWTTLYWQSASKICGRWRSMLYFHQKEKGIGPISQGEMVVTSLVQIIANSVYGNLVKYFLSQ